MTRRGSKEAWQGEAARKYSNTNKATRTHSKEMQQGHLARRGSKDTWQGGAARRHGKEGQQGNMAR